MSTESYGTNSSPQHRYLSWKKNPTFRMSNMVGLLFGPQCVIQNHKILLMNKIHITEISVSYLSYKLPTCISEPNIYIYLRDLIAVTGIVILRKLDSNNWFFILYDLKIRWITSKNNRAPLLGHIKLCALFQSHQWIQTGATIQKCSIRVKIGNFLSCVTLKFDRWPWKLQGTSSMLLQALCIIS